MRNDAGTILLSRLDVERLLTPDACIAAVEDAFRQLAGGEVPAPGILGMHADDGSFHVKAGFLGLDRRYFAAKLNANFPHNAARHGLPTIQGAVMLSDAVDGALLAIMDSISITALRTAAATAVATKYLARDECETALICGCGGQAAAQLRSLVRVRKPRRILAYDKDAGRAAAFAAALGKELAIPIAQTRDLAEAIRASAIVVTCTTARSFFVTREMVRPGTFIAAVGADDEQKQEIEPLLLAGARVVTDLTGQASRIGDLHHAIVAGAMSGDMVHAELGEVITGRKPGRLRDDETFVFDSTGTGLQDVAAAIAVYRRALAERAGTRFVFSSNPG